MARPRRNDVQTPPPAELHSPGTQRDMWLTWLCGLGPTLWFLLLVSIYASSQHECETRLAAVSLTLVAAGCLGCVGACGLLLRMRQRHRREPERSPIKHNRVHFMIDSGLILNVGSLLLLIGFVLPLLELRPCE